LGGKAVIDMSEDLQRLRREIRADFELTWGSQAATNTRLEELAVTLDQVSHGLKAMADSGRKTVGRLRQLDRRFSAVIDVLERDMLGLAPLGRLESLEQRVAALEQKSDPAA
jgi:hypothetical protein